MSIRDTFKKSTLPIVTGIGYLSFGIYLFHYTQGFKVFSDEQLILDLLWLDAWSLSFFVLLIILWKAHLSWKGRGWLCATAFGIYCFITASLIFDGTAFSFGAYWGDQSFRQAMITKFLTFVLPVDFYYKDLPPFYPPVYYYLLSMYGRLFSVEAYKLLKIGSMLTYLVGPAALYWCWRKLVSSMQAILITMISYLFLSYGTSLPFISPPTFIASVLFVPWWLFYVEQTKTPVGGKRYYVVGGITGAIIFATYPYPFFVGGLLVLFRTVNRRLGGYLRPVDGPTLRRAWTVLGSAALISAPYWLPPLIAIFLLGGKPTTQEYYHIGRTGILFKFLEFSIPGILFLGGLFYSLRRPRTPVNSGLLSLVGAVLLFHLVGSLLGCFERPVNLSKAMEFLLFLAGPLIGLAAAGMIKSGFLRSKSNIAVPAVLSLLLLLFFHNFHQFARHPRVKMARTSHPSTCNLNPASMENREGSVFLTADNTVASFYPVFFFISINQHYSHPASQFEDRYEFLHLLQDIGDPHVFNGALRHNRYDRTDFFHPKHTNGHLELSINLSAYPNKSRLKTLVFDENAVGDTSLFHRQEGNLYQVLDSKTDLTDRRYSFEGHSTRDSLLLLYRVKLISTHLDSVGRDMMDTHHMVDWKYWREAQEFGTGFQICDELELVSSCVAAVQDSMYLFSTFKVVKDVTQDYKVFFHLYGNHDPGQMMNYDFWPGQRTTTWTLGDYIICSRAFPNPGGDFNYTFGFFNRDGILGETFEGHIVSNSH